MRASTEQPLNLLGAAILPENDPLPEDSKAPAIPISLAVASVTVGFAAERFDVVFVACAASVVFAWLVFRMGMRPRRMNPETTSFEGVVAYPLIAAIIAAAALVAMAKNILAM